MLVQAVVYKSANKVSAEKLTLTYHFSIPRIQSNTEGLTTEKHFDHFQSNVTTFTLSAIISVCQLMTSSG